MGEHKHPDAGECAESVQELYGYLDGELTDERRATIGAHLDACGGCLEAFDFEAELRTVIATRCRDEVPTSLRMRIANALLDIELSR